MVESKRSFRGVPADASAARRFVREALDGLPVDLDQAVLIAGELATNSIRHAPGAFAVVIRRSVSEVLVGVTDASPGAVPVLHVDADSLFGRGMLLVDRLAEEWHVEAGPDGKTVWARLRRR